MSHLMFVDHCLLFGEATERRAKEINGVLEEYEALSGQSVNYDKSTIFFSFNS